MRTTLKLLPVVSAALLALAGPAAAARAAEPADGATGPTIGRGTMHELMHCTYYRTPYPFTAWMNNQTKGTKARFYDSRGKYIYSSYGAHGRRIGTRRRADPAAIGPLARSSACPNASATSKAFPDMLPALYPGFRR